MLTTEGSNQSLESVKIKKEKLTPPTSPNVDSSKAADGLNITDDLLNNILGERKPVESVKSSNELLADLFKVFNAPPPTLDDGISTKDSKKKKHKKEKKLKKHKKRSRDNSDSKSSDDDVNKIKKHKAKKSKKREAEDKSDIDGKSHKRHKKSKERDIKIEKLDVVIKKEHNNNAQQNVSKVDGGEMKNDTTSNKQRTTEEKNPQLNIQVSVIKDNDGSGSKRKIVIKSLVDSTVYQDTLKEVDTKQKEKEREKLKEKEKQKDREKEKAKEKDKERSKEKERRKQSSRRSKSHEKEHRRKRSHSSSLSLSDEETYLRERERERHKDRDRDRERDDFYGEYRRDTDRDRDKDRDFERRKHRSRNDFYRHDHDRRRSRSSSRHRRERTGDRIDKKRLLEIARKNAITMLKNGTLPGAHNLDPEAKELALTKMRYGGKSVDELTEFCKKLSKGETNGYLSNISGDSDIDADLEKPFHHPFVIKDRGPIVMNIKNSTPIPPKSAEQTKAILQQFPVSSGQHHRQNESEWVPVVPAKPAKTKETEPSTTTTTATTTETSNTAKSTTVATLKPKVDDVPQPTADYGYQNNMFAQPPEPPVSFALPANIESVPLPTDNPTGDNIFADRGTGKDLDVTSIVTSRLNALRKLQENPLDSEAIKLMYKTQKDMSAWASSKFVPGQFTGSTGASILSTKELASGFQAWAKRDQLISTTPVSGGMGMHLLQKMGWKPGEGLGKEKNGSLQPLLLEVKLDKKGLVAEEESPQVQRQRAQLNKKANKVTTLQMAKQNFESKHPVSLLGELSAKRKLGAPLYELVMQEGPSHQRQFLYSVTLNSQVYQPNVTSLNKKEAKAAAAKYALQRMGFLSDVPTQAPPAPPPQAQEQVAVQNNMNFAPPNAF